MKLHFLAALLLFTSSICKLPPIFNYSYQVSFDVTVIHNKQEYHSIGQEFYDPANNRERVDLANGEHNAFCGTILPNVNTPCHSLTVGGNRWTVFPSRSQCCLCCTSQHGCGILAPDWLKGADYQGISVIDGASFDKWHEKGAFSENYLYVTVDEEYPRRLDEGG